MRYGPAEYEFGTWEANRLRIQYPLALMEQIRRAVLDGFYALPHGGIEVGGVLYGSREGQAVHLSAFRPLECEHAAGPAFVLSPNDEASLRGLLGAPQADPALAGLLPVGWYHSHNRSGIYLTEQDLDLYQRYFPEPWQVALVLRPYREELTQAGFFIREADGSVKADASYQEFTLAPYPNRTAGAEAPQREIPPASPAASPGDRSGACAQSRLPAPPRIAAQPAPAARPGRGWLWLALSLLAAFALLGIATRLYLDQPAPPFSLRALDSDGQLIITWDRSARPVLEAWKGGLDIMDGTRRLHFELDPERLRKGSITYARQAERVELRMTLYRRGWVAAEEVLTFVGRPIPNPGAQAAASEAETLRQRDELARELERLRAVLRTETARKAELEEAMRILRQRLQTGAR